MNYFIRRTSLGIFILIVFLSSFISCRKYAEQNTVPERCEDCGFISLWEVGDSKKITIPVSSEYKYDYTIFWSKEDSSIKGREDVVGNQDYTLKLPSSGKYLIKISGKFPAIRFGGESEEEKLLNKHSILEVRHWGDIEWKSMKEAFRDCLNLKITAKDSPNLSKVVSMEGMFWKASSFNENINHWDVSNITNMKNMFRATWEFNQPLDNWNVANVKTMEGMFYVAKKFNQNINHWNVSNVSNMKEMFAYTEDFNQPLSNWNVSNVINMKDMFFGSNFNQDISNWKLNSNVIR